VAHAVSSTKIVSAAKLTLRERVVKVWAALENAFLQRWSLARPTYHDLRAQTMTIEKQDSNEKKNLTSLRQH
jgi:hypothetical protein